MHCQKYLSPLSADCNAISNKFLRSPIEYNIVLVAAYCQYIKYEESIKYEELCIIKNSWFSIDTKQYYEFL